MRNIDYDRAKELFTTNVVGYGTRTRRAQGLGELVKEQWERIWPKTCGFEFNMDELDFFHDAHMAHVAVTWRSYAKHFGTRMRREGRASLLLVGTNKKIKCAASHFSLNP